MSGIRFVQLTRYPFKKQEVFKYLECPKFEHNFSEKYKIQIKRNTLKNYKCIPTK